HSVTSQRPVARLHARNERSVTRRSRRRLRREIHFAGCAVLGLVPILSACTLEWRDRPNRILACSISDPLRNTVDGEDLTNTPQLRDGYQPGILMEMVPKQVVLSTEPAIAIPRAVVESPVIFPGYVLPDDTCEGLLHEGS